ncbi:MAG: hypothetical protein QOF25_2653, partial [Mycobacterium sp.]|nr:hypothetical protein [Mycobacterium sp.]
MRIAAAAYLMASGLLVAGTGASLALADPRSGDTNGSQNGSVSPATGAPEATATIGAPVPPAGSTGTGAAAGQTKPSSQVGDGRNGLPVGAITGSGTAEEPALPTDAVPTTLVTEPLSKPSEPAPTFAPPTGSASPSEQAAGVTTRVSVGPSVAASASSSAPADVLKTTAEAPPPPTESVGLGWPWSWWNWYPPLAPGGGGGSVGAPTSWQFLTLSSLVLPIPQFPTIPRELVPRWPGVSFDPLIDALNGVLTGVNSVVTGLATAASQLPFAQITLPVVVFPGGVAAGAGGGRGTAGAGGPGLAPRPGIPAAPLPPVTPHRGSSAPPPPPPSGQKQQPPPAFSAGNQASVAPSYRMGYMEYLRAAGFGQVAAVAVPGFTGILILTGAGGLIGYRQARAGS